MLLRQLPLVAILTLLLTGMAPGALGDRLVLAINTVAYTQRQVEVYITVKESLRKTDHGSTRTVTASNWPDALAAFTEDMVLLQEAQRLGSFSSPDQMVDKYAAVVQDKRKQGAALDAAFLRLGIDQTTLVRSLDTVLRAAAFRRSKDRQEAQQTATADAAAKSSKTKWLESLVERANVRHFADAQVYLPIAPDPSARGGGHGL